MGRNLVWILGAGLALATPASGQVRFGLPDVTLEYRILLLGEDDPLPIGSSRVTFTEAESRRGPQIETRESTEYTLPTASPFPVRHEVLVVTNEKGIVRYSAEVVTGDVSRKYVGLATGDSLHVTTTTAGAGQSTQTFPNDVPETSLAFFSAGRFRTPLRDGGLIREIAVLLPTEGSRAPYVRARESIIPFRVSADRSASVIFTRLHHQSGGTDLLWHTNDERQLLVRWDQKHSLGTIRLELTSINGVPLAESEDL